MTKPTEKDYREFTAYLKQCTDAQVIGVYKKENAAGRDDYAGMALLEAGWRGLPVSGLTDC